jgi:hypothetical protein
MRNKSKLVMIIALPSKNEGAAGQFEFVHGAQEGQVFRWHETMQHLHVRLCCGAPAHRLHSETPDVQRWRRPHAKRPAQRLHHCDAVEHMLVVVEVALAVARQWRREKSVSLEAQGELVATDGSMP